MNAARYAIIALALGAHSAFAFQNEPAGFRGIDWDTPLETVKDELVLLLALDVFARSSSAQGPLATVKGKIKRPLPQKGKKTSDRPVYQL